MSSDLETLDSLGDEAIGDILRSWSGFCACTQALLDGRGDLSVGPDLVPLVATLCRHGLTSLVQDHFLHALEVAFFPSFLVNGAPFAPKNFKFCCIGK